MFDSRCVVDRPYYLAYLDDGDEMTTVDAPSIECCNLFTSLLRFLRCFFLSVEKALNIRAHHREPAHISIDAIDT